MYLLRKVLLLTLFILGLSCMGMAQQEPQFSQYMFNRLNFNPAYAGSGGSICATGLYRSQWLGLKLHDEKGNTPSTPQQFLLSVDAPVSFLHGGLGGTILSDQIGYGREITLKLDYAYRFYFGPGNFALGLELDMANANKDYQNLFGINNLTSDPSNPVNSDLDPLLSGEAVNDFLFDMSAGLYYQIPGLMYAGISSTRLLESSYESLSTSNKRHYFLTGGMELSSPSFPSLKFMPSMLLKTDLSGSFQVDVTAIAEYQRLFWVGLGYRVEDAVTLLGGVNWNGLKIGASYDITTSNLGYAKSGRSVGSLELFVRYCFKVVSPKKPPTIYRNTRNFD